MSKATFDPTRYNNSSNQPFSSILEKTLNRRGVIKGGAGMAALGMFSGFALTGCSDDDDNSSSSVGVGNSSSASLGFSSIAGSKTDAVAVAEGYTASILAPWAEPLFTGINDFQSDGTNTAFEQANAMGMHHDGMWYFPLNGSSDDGILCVNHEYVDQDALHPNGPTRDPDTNLRNIVEEIRKEINAHGVSVVRIQRTNGTWNVVKNDPANRRITGATSIDLGGPVAFSNFTRTKFSQDGSQARGTLNNCGNGYTPWGTYLTCEENWPGYFVNTGTLTDDQDRIGLSKEDTRYGWDDLAGDASEQLDEFARFDVTPTGVSPLDDYRNEANGHGYIVEIDPYSANTRAVKRTAMGRFRHEGCVPGVVAEGQPVVFYSGHDARFEYMYKFVSDALWDSADADPSDRLAIGSKYMDQGTLYVARFEEDGRGEWLPLTLAGATLDGGTLGDTYSSTAEIIINTVKAADLVGATPMDRPEWAAVDPVTGSVYLTLTNNTRRTAETGTNAANPRLDNAFGHIIRWDEDATGTGFSWDIFVFGSPADGDADTNRSGLTNLNQFASPDGLVFDDRGIMWVQTDNGASAVTEETNDQMLAVIPSQLRTSEGSQAVLSSDNQDGLRRFFVGPNGCEVTGLAFNPDMTAFFINIQHPGNWPFSNNAAEAAPAGTTVRPRAATVVIQRTDGGKIGA